MTRIEAITLWLKQQLSKKRFKHSLGVAEQAVLLAQIYGVDTQEAKVAGLLHDCAKDLSDSNLLKLAKQSGIMVTGVEYAAPSLLHGPVGARIAAEAFDDINENILAAISYHTTGRLGMSRLEQIIYVADIIEPGRDFPGVFKLRELVGKPLPQLVGQVMDHVLQFLLRENLPIDTRTVLARNEFCMLRDMGDRGKHRDTQLKT